MQARKQKLSKMVTEVFGFSEVKSKATPKYATKFDPQSYSSHKTIFYGLWNRTLDLAKANTHMIIYDRLWLNSQYKKKQVQSTTVLSKM